MPVPAPLRQPRMDHPGVAGGILVDQALQHPGDNLHVAMGMSVKPLVGPHDVVVVDQQQAVMGCWGNRCCPNEKECFESSQPIPVL
jgi:hypothetical protein